MSTNKLSAFAMWHLLGFEVRGHYGHSAHCVQQKKPKINYLPRGFGTQAKLESMRMSQQTG